MSSAATRAPRYNTDRPELSAVAPWSPLAHIARELPRRIAGLVTELGVGDRSTVLDYGCAQAPYRHLFGPGVTYHAADLAGNPRADLHLRDDGTVPLPDASVDAVLSTQVLEHVADPGLYLSECRRVLRPGGRMLLSTHGIMVYHPDPVDLWRWTCAGLERAVGDAGLRVVRLEGVMGLAATGLQLLQDSILVRVPAPLRKPLALAFQALIALADRTEAAERKRLNALVFAVVAERPAE